MTEEKDPRGFNFEENEPPSPPLSSEDPEEIPLSAQPEEVHSRGVQPVVHPGMGGVSGKPTSELPGDPLASMTVFRDDSVADSSNWDWTKQYQRPARSTDKPLDDELYGVDDPAQMEDADLASIYIDPDKVKRVHNPDLSFVPPKELHALPIRLIFTLIFLTFLVILFLSATVKLNTGQYDVQGHPIQKTPLQMFWFHLLGEPESLDDPNLRGYQITKSRIYEVYSAAVDYERKSGSFPATVAKLVEEGLLSEEGSKDGWGTQFFSIAVAQRIVSCGTDRRADTSDDLYIGADGKLVIPSLYGDYEFDKTGF